MLKVHRWFILVGIIFIVFILFSFDFKGKRVDDDFARWLVLLEGQLLTNGISEKTVRDFMDIVEPVEELLILGSSEDLLVQRPEFNDDLILKSQIFLTDNLELLKVKELQYSVPLEVIVASLAFGSKFGVWAPPYEAVNVLSTLAFLENTNDNHYTNELYYFLSLVDLDHIMINIPGFSDGTLPSLGILPSLYQRFGLDANENNVIDLVDSKDDILESIYFMFYEYNWDYDAPLGYHVRLSGNVNYKVLQDEENARYVSDWESIGVSKLDGSSLEQHSMVASLLIDPLDNRRGLLLYPNFYIMLKLFNNAHSKSVDVVRLSEELVQYGDRLNYQTQNVVSQSQPDPKLSAGIKEDDLPVPEKYKCPEDGQAESEFQCLDIAK